MESICQISTSAAFVNRNADDIKHILFLLGANGRSLLALLFPFFGQSDGATRKSSEYSKRGKIFGCVYFWGVSLPLRLTGKPGNRSQTLSENPPNCSAYRFAIWVSAMLLSSKMAAPKQKTHHISGRGSLKCFRATHSDRRARLMPREVFTCAGGRGVRGFPKIAGRNHEVSLVFKKNG